jgi:hypothetical protein
MITYIFGFGFFRFFSVLEAKQRNTHVKRFAEPSRITVEKGTASQSRVNEIYGVKRGHLWRGLLEHEWFKCGLEAQQRCKRDVHH